MLTNECYLGVELGLGSGFGLDLVSAL